MDMYNFYMGRVFDAYEYLGAHVKKGGVVFRTYAPNAVKVSLLSNVTLDVDSGGLGFDYKWDMGWMHDTLEYFQSAPEERTDRYHKLTFSMMYYYNDRYLLPFSHDEVVHGQATILHKMNGQCGLLR